MARTFRLFVWWTIAVTGLTLVTEQQAQAWGRRPASQYVPGYGWTYPSSPALYGYAPYGYYADYGTYFRGIPWQGWSGMPSADGGHGMANYGFGAYSGSTGYPSIGYQGLTGAPAAPVGLGAGK
jgi:hypothetical protein